MCLCVHVCVYIYIFFPETYFKELACMIVEAGKSEIHKAGGRLGTQARFFLSFLFLFLS